MTRVLPILATMLALTALVPASTASADEVELLFHRQMVVGYEVIHASSLVAPSPPPPGPPPSVEDQALHDAIQWLITKNIFQAGDIQNLSFSVSITSEGIVIYSSWPNGDLTIILSNGPILPKPVPEDWLINVNVVRSIYNGF